MKLPQFTIYDLRFTRGKGLLASKRIPATSTRPSRQSQIANRKSGIALIITLILLAVTLVMAIAFLAISRRERGSVSTETDTIVAKYAADAALAHAEDQIVGQMLATTNPFIFSLLVSTNYINGYGFNALATPNPTNVNYDFVAGGGPLTPADFEQNVANLYYYPRPPVSYGSNDSRYYLDLNQNGRFDTNGWVTNFDNNLNGLGSMSFQVGDPEWVGILEHPDAPHGPNNPFVARYCFIAVPANSLDLNYIHNQALHAPAASAGTPAGTVNPPPASDYFSRNQGVGTWEINLAAFLADLNTNRWNPTTQNPWNSLNEPYSYPEALPGVDSVAFDDARALTAWRYNNFYPLQPSADSLFGLSATANFNAMVTNGIDSYTLGQQTTFDTNYYSLFSLYGENAPTFPWVGAENTNNYFNFPSDLFDTNKAYHTSSGIQQFGYSQFATNLAFAGTYNSTYDRYTYYRMLGQLGTDTLPASGKVNVNYQNAIINYDRNPADIGLWGIGVTNIATGITIVPNMETNFLHWQPQDFFTAAANQLLRAYSAAWFEFSPSNYVQTYYGMSDFYATNLNGMGVTNIQWGQTNQIPTFGINNIPVFVNGQFVYTPAVNRLLQLAANIYDASTNTLNPALNTYGNYPSVFRPIFWVTNESTPNGLSHQVDVYIRGYQYVPEPLPLPLSTLSMFAGPIEINDPSILNLAPSLGTGGISFSNVWGVPWIIGAKKGLPNFNGLEVDNEFFIERLLQFRRTSVNNYSAGTSLATILSSSGYTTNQMYEIGVSNLFAIEDWNSYASNYVNTVGIIAQDNLSFSLSNDAPGFLQITNPFNVNNGAGGAYQPWPGNPGWPTITSYNPYSFIMPLGTNTLMQNLSPYPDPASTNNMYIYYYGSGGTLTPQATGYPKYSGPIFIPTSANVPNFQDQAAPQLPHLVINTTNRLQAYMVDYGPSGNLKPFILDYVQLGGMNSSLDVNQAIHDPEPDSPGYSGNGGLWSTNTYGGGGGAPLGINIQYLVSSGQEQVPNVPNGDGGQWVTTQVPGAGTDTSPTAQAAFFDAFFSYDNQAAYGTSGPLINTNLVAQAPFTPMRLIVQRYVYQANDPLVHYLTSDLYDFVDSTNIYPPIGNSTSVGVTSAPPQIRYIGSVSDRYMPWGVAGNLSASALNGVPADANANNLSYKDPLVYTSDNWDFPYYKYPTVGWLGRVHRGTPWQTVFLKSTNLMALTTSIANGPTFNTGLPTWQLFTGDTGNNYDAYNTAPVWDHLLFDLFTAAPDDDATRGQVNVNLGASDPFNVMAGLASWSAVFSGSLAFSNNVLDSRFNFTANRGYQSPFGSEHLPSYSVWTNQPLGSPPYPNNPIIPGIYTASNSPMWQIVQGINGTRLNTVNLDGLTNVFEHVGDILSVPQLSDASPFLNSADTVQQQYGISDEMYEWMPQNLLGLMTVSGTPQTPQRYVVYCYGQTLKPAANGIVPNGSFFGLCTNYQVTAESAARAVIRVVNAPTPANPTANPRVVVEQFTPLPPD